MADQIILTKLDDEADRILDAFADETGLEREDHADHAHFPIEADDHDIDVVQTLTDIDEDWTEHVGLGDPA